MATARLPDEGHAGTRPSPWHPPLGGIPPGEFLRRLGARLTGADVGAYAAQLAYYLLFAMFPFLLFLAALLAYVPIPDLLDRIIAVLSGLLPEQAMAQVEGNVERLVTEARGGLLTFGIVAALWSASIGFAAISRSLNRVYGVRDQRPFWKRRAIAVLMTVGLGTLIMVSAVLLIFGPPLIGALAERLGLGAAFEIIVGVLRWPVIVLIMMFTVALIYYLAPDVEQSFRWITPGSVVAVLVWILASLGFAWYVENFGNYNRVYGSIGAIIILLTWLYLTAFFLLAGGAMNAVIEFGSSGGKDAGERDLPPGDGASDGREGRRGKESDSLSSSRERRHHS